VLGGNVPVVGDYSGPASGEAKADYDYFRQQGFSDVAAAGILGVLSWESGGGEAGINPRGRNPGDGNDGSDSIGAAQWNSGRADALKEFAR
ncbi:phage tail tip lysozyme, partial [Acinetobacter baumannii]